MAKCPKRLDSFVEATLKSLTILAAGHAEPRLVVWQGCALLYQFNQNNRYYLSEKKITERYYNKKQLIYNLLLIIDECHQQLIQPNSSKYS